MFVPVQVSTSDLSQHKLPLYDLSSGNEISVDELLSLIQKLNNPHLYRFDGAELVVSDVLDLLTLKNRAQNTEVTKSAVFSDELMRNLNEPAEALAHNLRNPPPNLEAEECVKFSEFSQFVAGKFSELAKKFWQNPDIGRLAIEVAVSALEGTREILQRIEIAKALEDSKKFKPDLISAGAIIEAKGAYAGFTQFPQTELFFHTRVVSNRMTDSISSLAGKLEVVTHALNEQARSVASGVKYSVESIRSFAVSSNNSASVEAAVSRLLALDAYASSILPSNLRHGIREEILSALAELSGTGLTYTAPKPLNIVDLARQASVN